MSDQDPYEPTRRLDGVGDPAHERTRPVDRRPADRTQRLPPSGESGPPDTPRSEPISYTEDYAAGAGDHPEYERTVVDRGPGDLEPRGEDRRTFTTMTLVLTSIAALLIGAILTLLLLPEEDPEVVLSEQAAQQALTEAQQANAEQAARITELEAQLAQRDAEIAQLQAQQAEDQSAADQAAAERDAALTEREAALDERDASLDAREQAIAQREADVAAREQAVAEADQPPGEEAGGGFELPDVPDLDVPGELPEIDEEAARGVIERFVDRLQSIFGSDE